MDYEEYAAQMDLRKVELGIDESPEAIEALRNKGERRTESKRRLLQAALERSLASGLEPVACYFHPL